MRGWPVAKRRGNSVRLVTALSVAATSAVFFLDASIGGASTSPLRHSQLSGHRGEVSLTGRIVDPLRGSLAGVVFVAVPDSLVDEHPSRDAPSQAGQSR